MATNKSGDYQIQIYRGLELLAGGLRPWCETKMEVRYGRNWSNVVKKEINLSNKYIDDVSGKPKLYDPYILLLILIFFWRTEGKDLLSPASELKIARGLLEVRNSWAHFERIDANISTSAWTLEETEKILTDIRALLEKVSATEYVKKIDELVRHLSYKYIDWQDVCSQVLNWQMSRVLNKLLGRPFSHPSLLIPSTVSEIKDFEVHSSDSLHEKNDKFRSKPVPVGIFCESLPNHKYLAVIGDGGSGKTTFLYQVALQIISKNLGLPIFISLADLRIIKKDGDALEKHLRERWLKEALPFIKPSTVEVTPELESALWTQFDQAQVWLLLDAADEMDVQDCDRLSLIEDQLHGWLSKAKVLLSCRPNVWNSTPGAFQRFTTYKIEGFNYGTHEDYDVDQVGQFIENWFGDLPKEGAKLRALLNSVENQRIRDLVRNPLRLSLLCSSWRRPTQLLETQASLYSSFVKTFYKASRVKTSKQKVINKILGTLAQWALNQKNSRFRIQLSQLPEDLLEQLGDEDDEESVLSIALKIGFLTNIGFAPEDSSKFIYAFCHASFQEYFASLAIDDWSYFFPKDYHNNELCLSIKDRQYRIFEPQWKEVILFWIGQTPQELSKKTKRNFIEAICAFDDNCDGSYSWQATFLAASCLLEFKECPLSSKILTSLIKGFCCLGKNEELTCSEPRSIAVTAKDLLQTVGSALSEASRKESIELLNLFLQSPKEVGYYSREYTICYDVLESLLILDSQILNIENLIKDLKRYRSFSESDARYVVKLVLKKVGTTNQEVVQRLLDILKQEYTRKVKSWQSGKDKSWSYYCRKLVSTHEEIDNLLLTYGDLAQDAVEILSVVSLGSLDTKNVLLEQIAAGWNTPYGYIAFLYLQEIVPNDIDVKDFLLDKLAHGDAESKCRSIRCLLDVACQDRELEAVRIYLGKLLVDQDAFVRKEAARAMLRLNKGHLQSLETLVQCLFEHPLQVNNFGQNDCFVTLVEVALENSSLINTLIEYDSKTDIVDEISQEFALRLIREFQSINEKTILFLEKLLDRESANHIKVFAIEVLSYFCPQHRRIKSTLIDLVLKIDKNLSKKDLARFRNIAINIKNVYEDKTEIIDLLTSLFKYDETLTISQIIPPAYCAVAINILVVLGDQYSRFDFLLDILQKSRNREFCLTIIQALGYMNGNQSVIDALESHLTIEKDHSMLIATIESLMKISPGHSEAHIALADLLIKEAERTAISLPVSDIKALVPVKRFKKLLSQVGISTFVAKLAENSEIALSDCKCLDMLWFCSQKIAYLEFYQAWHGSSDFPVGTTPQTLELKRIYDGSPDELDS
jgi:NACHT domain/Swt1-like HEPN